MKLFRFNILLFTLILPLVVVLVVMVYLHQAAHQVGYKQHLLHLVIVGSVTCLCYCPSHYHYDHSPQGRIAKICCYNFSYLISPSRILIQRRRLSQVKGRVEWITSKASLNTDQVTEGNRLLHGEGYNDQFLLTFELS